MRQETIIKTYKTFNELDKTQQAKVIEHYRDINVDHDQWHDFIIEDWTTKLEKLGFSNVEINYTGFGSQGDGASFTAKHNRGDVYRTTHHYYHHNTITSDNEAIKLLSRRLSQEIYKDLNKAYYDLISDEQVIETLIDNDYEFDIDTLKIG